MRILVVDDESEMAALLSKGLAAEGHAVTAAADGVAALAEAGSATFEVAILDVGLPVMSGFELCRRLKDRDPEIAIILLTARDAVDDRVRGLDSGADDYLTKPFAFAELNARIRAVRRRDALSGPRVLVVGSVVVDLPRHRVEVAGRAVPTSRTEFDVLRILAARAGGVVARSAILDEVWGGAVGVDPNVVDQYISYLRRKVAVPGSGATIRTVRGVGYSLAAG